MTSQNLNSALVALPALTAPVTLAQVKTLAANMAQLANLNNREVLAVSVVAKCRTLNHKGTWATSYISNHRQLRIDAQSFMGGFEITINEADRQPEVNRMQAVIDWSSAYGNDATTPSTINGLMVEAGDLPWIPPTTLEQIYFFLRYLIG